MAMGYIRRLSGLTSAAASGKRRGSGEAFGQTFNADGASARISVLTAKDALVIIVTFMFCRG
jgi:hypothetical protein